MLNIIKAGLKVADTIAPVAPVSTPEKDVPIQPFKGVGERAPSGFEFEKYKLMQPEDLRKFKPTLDKLDDRSTKVKEMDEKAKEMRVNIEEKIKELQKKEGYEQLKTDMAQAAQKVNDELIPYFKEAGNTLMAYKDTVFTVIDTLKKESVTEEEKKAKLMEALNKFMAPEISGKVIETFDSMVAELANSAAKMKQMKELKVWHPSKDLRKQIDKEVTTSKSVTADVKDLVDKFINFIKGLWDSLSEKVGDFFAAKEQADPIIDEMNALLGDTGVEASKKYEKGPFYQVRYLPSNSDNYAIEKGFLSKGDAERWAIAENLDNIADEWEVEEDTSRTASKKVGEIMGGTKRETILTFHYSVKEDSDIDTVEDIISNHASSAEAELKEKAIGNVSWGIQSQGHLASKKVDVIKAGLKESL